MGKATTSAQREASRARLKAAREAAAAQERRRKLIRRTVVAGSAVAVIGGLIAVGTLTGNRPLSRGAGVTPAQAATFAAAAAPRALPWTPPADQVAVITAAGLKPLGGEGTAEHYHAHLDVIVNGKPVAVPAAVGIDGGSQRISALHTHDGSGVIHIESPTIGTAYYLGQLFREWDVALTADQIGALRVDSGHSLRAYVNGKPVVGNPADIKLASHQEIAIIYGPANQPGEVPSGYNFGDL